MAISIHALRAESDDPRLSRGLGYHYFNPRPPRGERHSKAQAVTDVKIISIHALRAESDLAVLALLCTGGDISIHALRAESDFYRYPVACKRLISIHALRAESDGRILWQLIPVL